MLFLTPEMKKAFDRTEPYPDVLFFTSPEMKPIADERDEIDAEIDRTLSDAQYALVRRLVKNFVKETRYEFQYYFRQGWLAALAAQDKHK